LDFFATRQIGNSPEKTYHNRHPPTIILKFARYNEGLVLTSALSGAVPFDTAQI
jgi:hypothetical protein